MLYKLVITHRLRLRLGLCLGVGPFVVEREVGDEVAEVDLEGAAPHRQPLEVGHLGAGRQGQGQVNLKKELFRCDFYERAA